METIIGPLPGRRPEGGATKQTKLVDLSNLKNEIREIYNEIRECCSTFRYNCAF